MKHIFVVHSNITYLSALGVIAARGLADGDYLLVSEGFSRSHPVAINVLPYLGGFKANGYSLSRYFQPYKHIDRRIASLTNGEPFAAYISTVNKLARYLITNPMCAEFHFIEEGTSAYVPWIEFHTLTAHNSFVAMRPRSLLDRLRDLKLPLLRGYTSRISAFPLFYNAYPHPERRFYGFSESSHFLIDPSCRVLIRMSDVIARFAFPPTLDLAGSTVWLGDCVEISNRTQSDYLSSIEKGFVHAVLLKNSITEIFVKFHYREGESSRRATLDLFARHGIAVRVIPDSTIMEVELMACGSTNSPHNSPTDSAQVYGTYSSLLLYAALAGNRAYSVDRYYGGGLLDARLDFMWDYIKRVD